MIASEAQPFSKTGGLADVASALPKALAQLGHDVTLITPRYRGVTDGPVVATVSIEMAAHRFTARLMQAPGEGQRTLLLDCPELYDRPGIYYDARGDFADNAVRYAFLSAAAMEFASQQSEPFDIVHAHDWQAGLVPLYAHPRTLAPVAPSHPYRSLPSTTWRTRACSTSTGCLISGWGGTTSPSTDSSSSIA